MLYTHSFLSVCQMISKHFEMPFCKVNGDDFLEEDFTLKKVRCKKNEWQGHQFAFWSPHEVHRDSSFFFGKYFRAYIALQIIEPLVNI
jgi:hypothetical protein